MGAGMARDRRETERKLIEAAGRLMAREGFARLGVNAVAAEAGVDKVLIYRYFDGLPGLIRAYARQGDFWPGARRPWRSWPGRWSSAMR
jgi:AcrR family transcriptional regulator